MNEELKINRTAGIVGIIASIVLIILIVPGMRLTAELMANPFMNNEELLMQLGLIGIVIWAAIIPTLVLFIIGATRTKRAGLSRTGHVLGFVGMGTYFIMPYGVDIISVGLIVAGSIMIMRQTKVPINDWNSDGFN